MASSVLCSAHSICSSSNVCRHLESTIASCPLTTISLCPDVSELNLRSKASTRDSAARGSCHRRKAISIAKPALKKTKRKLANGKLVRWGTSQVIHIHCREATLDNHSPASPSSPPPARQDHYREGFHLQSETPYCLSSCPSLDEAVECFRALGVARERKRGLSCEVGGFLQPAGLALEFALTS